MIHKLLIVLVNSDPIRPEQLVMPLFQATVAAALEYEVEIVLAGDCRRLAEPGLAAGCRIENTDKTVYQLMQEAHRAGVRLTLCGTVAEPIAEIDTVIGDAQLIQAMMRDDVRVLTF